MTLHWWMHWFWITSLALSVGVCENVLPAEPAPSGGAANRTTDTRATGGTLSVVLGGPVGLGVVLRTPPPRAPSAAPREPKAIGLPPPPDATASTASTASGTPPPPPSTMASITSNATVANETTADASDDAVGTTSPNVTAAIPATEPTVADNETIATTLPETTAEDGAAATSGAEVSTVRALSLETGVGRRAAAVPAGAPPSARGEAGLDAGAVAGISLGALALLGLASAVSFVLYRRRYLNKPQTLNDKCSNPDSSGYIDDSTVRENSEEMYSLDNDSFLNSLEAMTIQNYWTDSVKHTKL